MALHRYRPYQLARPQQDYNLPVDPYATADFVGNMARNTYDYWNEQGDFARPAKMQKHDVEQMEADSTSGNQIGAPPTGQATSGGTGFGAGYRGAFTGTTSTKKGYEKHYHEMQELHSKRITSRSLYWTISHWQIASYLPKLSLWTRGLVYLPDTVPLPNANVFNPWSVSDTDWTDYVYSQPINLQLGDFIDNKILSNNGLHGMMNNFRKLRLKSFTVEVTPVSYSGNLHETHSRLLQTIRNDTEIYSTANINSCPWGPVSWRTIAECDDPVSCDYWVFRDIYGDYIDNDPTSDTKGFIPWTPKASLATATSDEFPSRVTRSIRNIDRNLCVIKNKEKFSFTREINSQGAYYLTPLTIGTNFHTPIHQIVNELEGQNKETGDIADSLPEYFHLLIAPITAPILWNYGIVKHTDAKISGTVPMINLRTFIHLKCSAKWEAFDFKYQPTDAIEKTFEFETSSIREPLVQAEFDYRSTKVLNKGQMNRQNL